MTTRRRGAPGASARQGRREQLVFENTRRDRGRRSSSRPGRPRRHLAHCESPRLDRLRCRGTAAQPRHARRRRPLPRQGVLRGARLARAATVRRRRLLPGGRDDRRALGTGAAGRGLDRRGRGRLGRGDARAQRCARRRRSTPCSPRPSAPGATIGRAGAPTFWGGYSGVFVDPDGHPWEVAHNPFWTLREDGSVEPRRRLQADHQTAPGFLGTGHSAAQRSTPATISAN